MIKRILISIPILFVLSIAIFWAAREIGSPEAQLFTNPRIRPEDKQRFIENLGLDQPVWQQYTTWLGNFVRGDLGESLLRNGQEVWPLIQDALANTLVLIVVAVTISLAVGIGLGAVTALKQNSWIDHASTGLAFVGISIPVFWLGLMLQLFFAVYLPDWLGLDGPLLPTAGLYPPGQQGFDLIERARHLALPSIALAVQLIAVYSRYMRASMLEVLNSDYVRTARSKGIKERRVITRHGIRTALIPVTTQAAIDIGLLIGGLVITETIFQYPGMGRLFLQALFDGDYPLLLPVTMIVAFAVVVMNLLADLLYAVLDPRIRYA